MPRIENVDKLLRPGELYGKIKISREEFKPETKMEKRALHPFVNFCKKVYSAFPSLSRKASFKPEFQDAIEFLDWPLKPEELNAAVAATMIFSMVAAMTIGVIIYSLFGAMISAFVGGPEVAALYVFMPLIASVLFLTYLVQNFPLQEAKTEQVKALTYVPEIIGYMIMSMKLVPNLEKAVEFSAEHGKGKVAEDFKKILWGLQIGVYNTLSEALDILAYRWGKFSTEFKESLMRVRASVLEDTEAKRYQLLDETMEKVLDSVKNKMENYARSLSQPAVMLFYLGILLPLILIIILPVGSAFAHQSLARPELLILIYNIIIPAIALVFAFSIVRQRPPTYTAPSIPDNHPLLPKKWQVELRGSKADLRALIIIVLVIGFFTAFYLHSFGVGIGENCLYKPKGERLCFLKDQTSADVLLRNGKPANYFSLDGGPGTRMEEYLQKPGISRQSAIELVKDDEFRYFLAAENNIAPNTLIYILMISIVFCVFLYFYYTSIFKRRLQVQAMQMESEFKEALYIIASRMGENKPVETAMKHVQTFLPTYKVSSEIFGRTVHNIEVMGMPLEQAVFDKNFGSLKNNPSAVINSSMRLMIDSVKLGVGVASRTLISLSLQLSNSEKVNRMLKSLVSDVTSMMKLMSLFIAPAILGITTALQKVVMIALTSTSLKTPTPAGGTEVPGFGGFGSFASTFEITPEALHSLATPTHFLIIVAVYVIQVVIILTYFTTKIEEDNNILTRLNIAKALPIAVIVFLASTIAAGLVVGSFKGF